MGEEVAAVTGRRRWRSAEFWASASWVVFLVVMAVRLLTRAAEGGPADVLTTFLLIGVGTVGMIAVITLGIRLERRPLRRLVDWLYARTPSAVVAQAMATDDLRLGLRLLDPAAQRQPVRVPRKIVVLIDAGGVQFWTPANRDEPIARIDASRIVTIVTEDFRGPIGLWPTVVLTATDGTKNVVLPFLVIGAARSGLKPMDAIELGAFMNKVRAAL